MHEIQHGDGCCLEFSVMIQSVVSKQNWNDYSPCSQILKSAVLWYQLWWQTLYWKLRLAWWQNETDIPMKNDVVTENETKN